MYVFLLIIIPLMYFVCEYLCHNEKINREHVFCIFWGFVLACICALLDFFAIGANHDWINSVALVWAHYLITESIIPVVICVIPVMISKDRIRVKIQYVFPLLTAFMAVFLPYKVIAEAVAPDFFRMILYPLLVAAMLFNFDTAASLFSENEDISELLAVRCAVAAVAVISGLLLPSLFQARYFLNLDGAVMYILIGVYVIAAGGLRAVEMLFLQKK